MPENVDPAGQSAQAPVSDQPPVSEQPTPSHWLGETVKEHPSLERFKDPSSLAKSYLELEKGYSSRVPLPSPDAPQEKWDEYYNRMRPKDASEYKMEMPGIDDLDPGKMEKWKSTFHQAGLHPRQVEGILNHFTREIVEDQQYQQQQMMEQQTKTQVELKTQWGANYEANKGMILSMLREVGGEDLHNTLAPTVDHDPKIANFLYEAAKVMRSSGVLTGNGGSGFGLITVGEAQAEKQDIMRNPANSLYNHYHNWKGQPGDNPATKRLLELNTVISKG